MAGVVFNAGLDYLDAHQNTTDAASWTVRLYQNNHTPVSGDTLGSYTISTYPGYANQTPGFTFNAAAAGSKTIVSALMNFVSTGADAQSIYGYIVVGSDGTTALWGEKFTGGPYTIPSAGAGVQLTATLTDSSP